MDKLKYRVVIPLASLLLSWLIHRVMWKIFPPDLETCGGIWFDISYWKYVRVDKRRSKRDG